MSPSLTLGRLCSACQAVTASPALLLICTCLCICPCLPCWPVCAVPVLAMQMWWLLAAGFQEVPSCEPRCTCVPLDLWLPVYWSHVTSQKKMSCHRPHNHSRACLPTGHSKNRCSRVSRGRGLACAQQGAQQRVFFFGLLHGASKLATTSQGVHRYNGVHSREPPGTQLLAANTSAWQEQAQRTQASRAGRGICRGTCRWAALQAMQSQPDRQSTNGQASRRGSCISPLSCDTTWCS